MLLPSTVCTSIVPKSIASQPFNTEPKLYVLATSGTILLVTSAFIVTLSEESLPNIKFPSSVMLPVAFIFPVTFAFACNSIVPVPLGKRFTSALVT